MRHAHAKRNIVGYVINVYTKHVKTSQTSFRVKVGRHSRLTVNLSFRYTNHTCVSHQTELETYVGQVRSYYAVVP